jgi:hypothetical protein
MTRTRRTTVIGSFLVRPRPKTADAAPRDPQRELAMSVADGFTLAAVGDCIIARPVSQTPGLDRSPGSFTTLAPGNFEGTAIDLRGRPPPQAEFGGV